MTEEAKVEIERLLRSGARGEAIEYLRQAFGVSLQDASLLIETLEREMQMGQTAAAPDTGATLQEEVAEMLRTGRQSEALQHIRDTKKVGLREAILLLGEAARQTSTANSLSIAGCLKVIVKGLGVFFMIISIILLAAAGIIYFIQDRSIASSERLPAIVSDLKSNGAEAYAPVVQFEWNGQKRIFESTFYSTPPEYAVGEQLFVFVSREDPEDVMIDSFLDRWAIIVGLCVPGAIMLVVAIVCLYFASRKF